jgi:hypothetical protein
MIEIADVERRAGSPCSKPRASKAPRGGKQAGSGIDWRFLYGRIATSTGWTYRAIGELTMFDLAELADYWQRRPPVHELVAIHGFQEPGGEDAQNLSGPTRARAGAVGGVMAARTAQPMPELTLPKPSRGRKSSARSSARTNSRKKGGSSWRQRRQHPYRRGIHERRVRSAAAGQRPARSWPRPTR